jgi:hypothetical protein
VPISPRHLANAALCLTLALAAGGAAPPSNEPAQSVVSLRRLTEQEYRNSIADIFGKHIEVRGFFEPTARVHGLEAASTSTLSITPAGFESFNKMATSIATQVTAEKNRSKLPCAPANANSPDDACARRILAHYGHLLLRRPLTESELDNRAGLARRMAEKTGDFYTGLGYSLSLLLQLPDFLFKKESALPNGTLDSYSRATRLSYLLWNTTPDAELLKAAAENKLTTPAGLEQQVDRLMSSPRLEQGMRAFFDDMLQLNTFDTVSKDSLLYPKWGSGMAASAREETLRTVIGLTLHDNADVRDLMTTPHSYIDRRLATLYHVPFPFTSEWVKYPFPPDSGRSGLLTQISMLSMFSHPGRSSPTRRGVAIVEIFLCTPTPLPPDDVDFSLVNDPASPLKTVRARLLAHAENKACASCHLRSDPVGLALEHFDTTGGYRSTDNGERIDASATLQGHNLNGAQELGRFLHDDPRFPACLARRLYSYGRGAPGGLVSNFPEAYKSFQDSGYKLRTFLRALATSESFYKAAATTESASHP